jgi:ArsR family transcriptional regulator
VRVPASPEPATRALLDVVLASVRKPDFGHADDLERLERVRRDREETREAVFDEIAADWDTLREELLGGRLAPAEIASLLVPEGLRIVDAGAGTGVALPWLSAVAGPQGQVVAVERSAAMAARARRRAEGLANVEVRRGRIEDLPIPDAWADALVLSLALRQTADPVATLARCARAVCPGGRIVVADVARHGDVTLVERLGRGFAGFEPDDLLAAMRGAGLVSVRRVEAPPASHANGAARTARSRAIPRLVPLLACGVVPGAGRTQSRRK